MDRVLTFEALHSQRLSNLLLVCVTGRSVFAALALFALLLLRADNSRQ
jgi:hypothetical protein